MWHSTRDVSCNNCFIFQSNLLVDTYKDKNGEIVIGDKGENHINYVQKNLAVY